MTDSTKPPPPPPRTEAEEAKENGGPEEEEEEDVQMPPAPSAAVTAAAPAATVAAVAVAAPAQTGGGKRSPSDFLKTVLGRPVVVKLNSGIDYRGERFPAISDVPVQKERARISLPRGETIAVLKSRGWVRQTGGGVSISGGIFALVALVHFSVPGSFILQRPASTVAAPRPQQIPRSCVARKY